MGGFTGQALVAAGSPVEFNAHILETGTQSYRLRTSKNTRQGCAIAHGEPCAEHASHP
jgi:hypothetical protein